MKVAEFRKDLSNCLDRAVQGETIKIERAGQTFNLELANPLQRMTKRVKAIQESNEPVVIPEPKQETDITMPDPEWLVKKVAAEISVGKDYGYKPGDKIKITQTDKSVFDRETMKFCKHDAVLGMCKKGCK